MTEVELKAYLTPEVLERDGRWYIRVGRDYYEFPEGTTREHAESVLAEAFAIAAN